MALKSAQCFPDSEWFQQKVPSFFFKHDLIFNGFDLHREWKHLHVKFHITAFPLKKKSHFYKIIKSWTNTNLLVDFMVSIYFILNSILSLHILHLICGMNLLKYILPKYPPAGSSGPLLLGYYLFRESALRTKLSWLKLFTKWYKPSFLCVLVRCKATSYWRKRPLVCFKIDIEVENNHFCNRTNQ